MRAPLHTTATTVTTVTITRVDYCKRLPVGLLAQESLPTAAHVVTSHWLSFVTNGATSPPQTVGLSLPVGIRGRQEGLCVQGCPLLPGMFSMSLGGQRPWYHVFSWV